MTQYVFRGTSLFDPDLTGTGAQPTGFDEWAAFYNRYVVTHSKIRIDVIEVASDSDANSETVEVAIVPTPENGAPPFSDPQEAGEQQYGKFALLYPQTNGNPALARMTHSMSNSKIHGVSANTIVTESDFSALVNSNPNKNLYWNLYFQTADESSSHSYVVYVTLEFEAEFYDKGLMAPSFLHSLCKRFNLVQAVDRDQQGSKETAANNTLAMTSVITRKQLRRVETILD
jgi:hypothetical protein